VPQPNPKNNNNFHIRDFEASDLETLWRIDQDCFLPGISYSRSELRTYIQRRGAFTLVAVSSRRTNASDSSRSVKRPPAESADRRLIAGFIVAEAIRDAGHIITIDVIAAARRHGVGSLLLDAAEDRLRTAGCKLVELETAVDNISALSFYKRHGYTVVRTFPRYYSNGVDALVLQKRIAAPRGLSLVAIN
jgi:[ribosomal protein S18]-alanine N-acetyltransferase